MKLKDSEKSMLLVLLGVAILVLSFFYMIKPNYDSIQSIKSECVTLQARLNELQGMQAHREEYETGIVEYTEAFDELMARFPADLNQEVTIMFMEGIKDNHEFDIPNLGLGEKEAYYTLSSNGAEASLETVSTPAEASTEATTETTTEAPVGGELAEAALQDAGAYVCYRAAFPVTYQGSYDALKDVVAYIDNFSSRMTVDTLDITYDADNDVYSGNMNVMCYAIEGPDRAQSNMQLEDVETGVDNIFVGESSSSNSVISTMKKYDENNGAAIETSYDFYAMLNAATSDVSAKVVGQNGSGKEASVISNSDNKVSTLSYDFYEVDGKNYCKYTLDNSTSYEAEITSAEDVKLLLQSSVRKDEDDKAGVRITIRNSTSLPVYVKITGDDASSPRVQIVSKIGAVKVYK